MICLGSHSWEVTTRTKCWAPDANPLQPIGLTQSKFQTAFLTQQLADTWGEPRTHCMENGPCPLLSPCLMRQLWETIQLYTLFTLRSSNCLLVIVFLFPSCLHHYGPTASVPHFPPLRYCQLSWETKMKTWCGPEGRGVVEVLEVPKVLLCGLSALGFSKLMLTQLFVLCLPSWDIVVTSSSAQESGTHTPTL